MTASSWSKDGRIAAVGPASELMPRLPPATAVEHYPDELIMPGFIDPHIHYPQTQVIASYGAQLLEWLEKYTFVEEQKFADPQHAARNAEFFLDELARNGTTTAVAYCSAHPASAEALFAAAHRRNVGMIAGTAIMNRNGPPGLLEPAREAIPASRDLIQRWHGTRTPALCGDPALRHHLDRTSSLAKQERCSGISDRADADASRRKSQ